MAERTAVVKMKHLRYAIVLSIILIALGGVVGAAQASGDVSADRTINDTAPDAGDTVAVDTDITLESGAEVDFVDNATPAFEDATFERFEQGDETPQPIVQTADGEAVVVIFDEEDLSSGTVTVVYEVTIPDDADDGERFEIESVIKIDGSEISVTGDNSLTVGGEQESESGQSGSGESSNTDTDSADDGAETETTSADENGTDSADDEDTNVTDDEETASEDENGDVTEGEEAPSDESGGGLYTMIGLAFLGLVCANGLLAWRQRKS